MRGEPDQPRERRMRRAVEVAVATACVWLIVLEMKRRQKGTL